MHFHTMQIVSILSYLEPAACAMALLLVHYRGQISKFKPLSLFLGTRVIQFVVYIALYHSAGRTVSKTAAFQTWFYFYWLTYAAEAVLGFFIIYSLYNMAMAPLKGLQRLGTLMFRWAAGVAVAIAITMAFGPHFTSKTFVNHAAAQLQQTQSVLTLCMLLFVCLAIRPMGLSYRSKIFGVSLGLGVMATADLVGSAWLNHFSSVNSLYNIFNGIAICVTIAIWMLYFAMPEPRRRMIILPTTSPFLRWNQISLALGDNPGYVALGEFSPDMFAPAEVEVMRRASVKMQHQVAN